MPQSDLKRLALLMAVNCVRNTVIEDYHSDGMMFPSGWDEPKVDADLVEAVNNRP